MFALKAKMAGAKGDGKGKKGDGKAAGSSGRQQGPTKRTAADAGGDKGEKMAKIQCYVCHEYGHYANHCPTLRRCVFCLGFVLALGLLSFCSALQETALTISGKQC